MFSRQRFEFSFDLREMRGISHAEVKKILLYPLNTYIIPKTMHKNNSMWKTSAKKHHWKSNKATNLKQQQQNLRRLRSLSSAACLKNCGRRLLCQWNIIKNKLWLFKKDFKNLPIYLGILYSMTFCIHINVL